MRNIGGTYCSDVTKGLDHGACSTARSNKMAGRSVAQIYDALTRREGHWSDRCSLPR